MDNIVVNCSSLYNIDFSCAIFYKVDHPEMEMLLFLNDKASISSNKEHRKYISRLAVPLFEWEKDKDGSWKMLHYPIEAIGSLDEFLLTIERAIDPIVMYIENGGGTSTNVEETFHTIERALRTEFCGASFDPIRAYSVVILEVVRRVLKSREDVSLRLCGSIYEGNFKGRAYNQALLAIYNDIKTNHRAKTVLFVKGGKILVRHNTEWRSYNSACLDVEGLRLINMNDHSSYVFALQELLSDELLTGIRLTGPLELLLFMQFGFCADLPSYVSAKFTDRMAPGVEYISPVSVVDPNRVSIEAGGHGFRLNPSGYSLLDYCRNSNSTVIMMLRGMFAEPEIQLSDLTEWFEIINNYPRADEKISESQGSIRKIIAEKRRAARLLFRNLKTSDHPKEDMYDVSSVDLGIKVLKFMGMLSVVRESLSPHNNVVVNESFAEVLVSNGFLKNKEVQTLQIVSCFDAMFYFSITLFRKIGQNQETLDKMISSYAEHRESVCRLGKFEIGAKSVALYEEYGAVVSLNRVLELVVYEYYSFLIFMLTSVLKANIFTSSLFFGFESYCENIGWILKRRGENRCLFYEPVFYVDIDHE